jgi:DNA-binding beta-propeller fold protein YncE
MSGSSEADPQGCQGSVWVAGVAAEPGGDVERPCPAEHADDQVPQDRHDAWGGAGADLRGVLGEGDVAEVVQRFDGPVPAQQVGQAPGGAGLLERQAGDRLHGHRLPLGGVQVAPFAGDLDDLGGVRGPEVADRDRFAAAQPDAAAVAGAVAQGTRCQGRRGQRSSRVVADIPVPSEPHRVAHGAGAVWVGNWHDDSVFRIDPATNRVVGSPIPIGAHHAGNLVVGAGGVWVTTDYRVDVAAEDTVVVRIDAQTNRPVETIAVGGHPIDVAATWGAVWVSVANPGRLLRIAGR